MHKFRWKVHWQSVANSYRKVKELECGRNNVAVRGRKIRNFTTSHGCWKEPVTRLVREQIVDALRYGERSRASTLLLELGSGNHTLRANDFDYILQYCARSPDPSFAIETWKLMEEKEIGINGKCYFLAIRALCKGGYLKEAFNLMRIQGETPDTDPILPAYNNLLGASIRMNSVNYADECLDLMEHQMVGKNEITYGELLKLAVLQQNLSAVHEIWKECFRYYSLSIISLRKFIWSFSRLKDLEAAYATLQHMVSLAFRENFIISKTAEGKLYNLRLDIPLPSNVYLSLPSTSMNNEVFVASPLECNKEIDTYATRGIYGAALVLERKESGGVGISNAKKYLRMPVMKILRWSFTDVIHACANTRNYILAEQLMSQMQNLGLEPSANTYDGFIRAVLSAKGFHYGMEMLKVMQEKNMKPFDSTLAALSVSCSRSLELDLAEAFLNQISKSPSPYPYNAFLEACDSLDRPERAVRILAKMKELRVQPDIRTYELLFSLFGNVNAPYEKGNMLSQVDAARRINVIEVDMMNNGIQHSYLSMKNLLKALGAEGMIRELIQYLQVAENQFYFSNDLRGPPLYNTVLHSLVEAKECRTAIEIFRSMRLFGIPADAFTYNVMIDCCSVIQCFRSACALVSLMIRDGFNLEAVTYTGLIKILLGFGDFDEALKLLDQGRIEGMRPDVLLYNTFLRVASDKGRVDVIEFIVELMHQEKIQPDPNTCSFVFSAYVDHGHYSTAMEALQVLSMRMISEDDNTLEEKRTEFEHLTLSEETEAESKIIKLFKDYQEDLASGLLNLRWCATVGYSPSWLPNKNPWAKRLSSNYASRRHP